MENAMWRDETRDSIFCFVYGPVTKSLSFWVEILFVALAEMNFADVWKHAGGGVFAPIHAQLLLLTGLLVLTCGVNFMSLRSLRREAQRVENADRWRAFCRRADWNFRLFCGWIGILTLGLDIYLWSLPR